MGRQTQCWSGVQNVLPSIWQLVITAETPFKICWWNNDRQKPPPPTSEPRPKSAAPTAIIRPHPLTQIQIWLTTGSGNPGVWTLKLGSGKVAGKVLKVDHMLWSAQLLILMDSVTNWRLRYQKNRGPRKTQSSFSAGWKVLLARQFKAALQDY